MSIASELTNLEGNIEDSYDAVNDMGGIVPAQRNMDNLDQAIRTIPQNTGTTYTAGYGIDIDQNDEISVDTTVIAEKTDIPTNTSDLTNDGDDGAHPFIATDDYATNQTAGAVKVTSSFGVEMSNSGEIKGAVVSSADYPSMWNDAIVSKGTLENALSTKSYATTSDIPTNTSDLVNDGSDGTSTYVEADDLATVATSGLYSDLTGTPTIPAAQIQSDWTQTTTTALDYIKNKPEIRHVNAVSDAGWSADANKLVDGSVLAYWNGAYSGTASNLQYFKDHSIGCNHFNEWSTANTTDTWVPVGNGNKIQHRVIKAFNSDGSIPKSAMHGLPCPDYSTVITSWGTINSTSTKTTSADGYIIGKAIVNGTDKQALIEIGGKQVAGIPYNATSQINNFQVAFCIPVKSGTSVKFQCSGGTGGYFQGCTLIGWQM